MESRQTHNRSGSPLCRCDSRGDPPQLSLCGCGAFFCRRCSASPLLCPQCQQNYERRRRERHRERLQTAAVATARPLSRRLLLEATVVTALALLTLLGLFGMQSRSLSAQEAAPPLVSYGINLSREPRQAPAPFFESTIDFDGAEAVITSDTSYSISAKVEGIKAYEDAVAVAVPYDLLLTWGELAQDGVDSKLHWQQGERRGQVSGSLGGSNGPDVTPDYVISHVSNNHLLPANDAIRDAIGTIKPGDSVRIDGRLIDLRLRRPGRALAVTTSKNRTDQGEGACEIILVEQLRVNGKSY